MMGQFNEDFCALEHMRQDDIHDAADEALGFWGGVSVAFFAGVVMYFAVMTAVSHGGAY
jgi:hypothetical protein